MERSVISLILILALFGGFARSEQIAPPPQPEKGPGGKENDHSAVTKNRYGEGQSEYWIYEPDQPQPASAPLIVFFHGFGATNPAIYGAWIDHLVKRGNIVVYPRYQKDAKTPLKEMTPNAIDAIRNSINVLQSEPGHVQPELNKFAVAGHSLGGLITANVAALAREVGLPPVVAMMSVEPGRTWNPLPRLNLPLEDLKKIPEKTLLLAVIGDKDTVARDTDAKRIYYESEKVSKENKDFVTLVSDFHGKPPLLAHHGAPSAFDPSYDNGESKKFARNEAVSDEAMLPNVAFKKLRELNVNAIDFYGTWKLFDGLYEAAFYGKNREYALGNTPQQRNMGKWSDGVPVNKLKVTDNP